MKDIRCRCMPSHTNPAPHTSEPEGTLPTVVLSVQRMKVQSKQGGGLNPTQAKGASLRS